VTVEPLVGGDSSGVSFPVKDVQHPPRSPGSTDRRSDEPWTIGRLLSWTTDYLKRRGSESPRLDAEVLLAHVLDWQRVQLYTHFEEEVSERARGSFRELVRRRVDGAPVAYLVRRKEFYSLAFEVSPAVLIPRPESEFVVVEFLALAKGSPSIRAVDVGTGSGCLAIASAHRHPGVRFVAIDISDQALEIARLNAARHGVADRIDFRLGNVLEPVAGEELFDAVISNPPYIDSEEISRLERGVRDYEPRTALDGGSGGLRMVTRLIEDSVSLLKPGGHLILEIGTDQEKAVRALIEAQPELHLAPTIHDHAKHPRVIRASRRSVV
jgi:release factor glutamine methyltransferase